MADYAADYKARTGDEVTYNGRYQNTGIFLLKYLGRHGGNDGAVGEVDMGWDNNQRIYRYSETLLNAAELILRTGGDVAKHRDIIMRFAIELMLLPVLFLLIISWRNAVWNLLARASVTTT